MPSLMLGDKFPDFECHTTAGVFSLHAWAEQKRTLCPKDPWILFFSHPADFTPVCTTEISQLMKEQAKLEALNLYPIGLSVDNLESHLKWREHLSIFSGLSATDVPPIIADPNGKIASLLGMLDSYDHDPSNVINGIPLTVRSVFVLDHRMSVRAIWTYPASVGRLWSEIFRVVEALQLSEKYPIATPESWTPNSAVLIRANISTEDAMPLLPKDTKVSVPFSDIPYVRFAKL